MNVRITVTMDDDDDNNNNNNNSDVNSSYLLESCDLWYNKLGIVNYNCI
jgi:hypothetical protein